MRTLYLVLAVIGAIVPYVFFFQHFSSEGYSLSEFAGSLYANSAAGGFTSDLLLTSAVFWIAMFHQRKRGSGPNPALFIALNLFIGLSCAFPAYLYARQVRASS